MSMTFFCFLNGKKRKRLDDLETSEREISDPELFLPFRDPREPFFLGLLSTVTREGSALIGDERLQSDKLLRSDRRSLPSDRFPTDWDIVSLDSAYKERGRGNKQQAHEQTALAGSRKCLTKGTANKL